MERTFPIFPLLVEIFFFSFKVLLLANLEKQCFLCVQIDRYICSSVPDLADLFEKKCNTSVSKVK